LEEVQLEIDYKMKGVLLLSLATHCEVQGPDEWF